VTATVKKYVSGLLVGLCERRNTVIESRTVEKPVGDPVLSCSWLRSSSIYHEGMSLRSVLWSTWPIYAGSLQRPEIPQSASSVEPPSRSPVWIDTVLTLASSDQARLSSFLVARQACPSFSDVCTARKKQPSISQKACVWSTASLSVSY